MDVSSFLPASELFEKKLALQTLKKKLRRLNRMSVFSNLCVINSIFAKSIFSGNQLKEDSKIQGQLKENYLTKRKLSYA